LHARCDLSIYSAGAPLVDLEGNENIATLVKYLFPHFDEGCGSAIAATSSSMIGILSAAEITVTGEREAKEGGLYPHQSAGVKFITDHEREPLWSLSYHKIMYPTDDTRGVWTQEAWYHDRFSHETSSTPPEDAFGAALCVPMGLGKSRIVLEVVAQDVKRQASATMTDAAYPTLIVMPAALVEQVSGTCRWLCVPTCTSVYMHC
jgi:hypothetical protein